MGIVKQHHIDQYAEEGCVRVEGVFEADCVDRLVNAIDRCIELHSDPDYQPEEKTGTTQNPPSLHWQHGGVQLRNFVPYVPEFQDWVHNSIAAEVVGELMQAADVRFWQDATFVKQGPSESFTPWHNDVCTFPVAGEHLPSFWVALTDVDKDDGPMKTLAGSNHDPFRYHSPMSRQDLGLLDGYRPWDELLERCHDDAADIRIWEANRGDILLIHPKTIHASEPRRKPGDGRRIALTTRWVGSDVTWDPDPFSYEIKGLSDNPNLKPGDKLPEDLFPIIWRRDSL